MDLWDIEDIILALNKNEKALEALDNASREKVKKFASDTEKRLKKEAEARKKAEQRSAREIAERKEKQQKKYCELLGLNIGEWVRNIPKERRFALVQRIGKEYRGNALNAWKDKDGWVDKVQLCAIDLARGFMSPYWDYYGWGSPGVAFFRERLKPIFDTKTDDELAHRIEMDWDFFHVNKNYKGTKFAIVDYTIVGEDGNDIVINGHGPYKTLKQHFNDLKKEFGGK